ncbi:MAG: hypothetical protein IJF06_08420 [Bacteroidaceae bacterium]|nr:hypothetical protein [Bacteroidaceae bacterium]
MKVNRSSHSNLRFLYGSVFFFAMLVLTMVLFTYYAMNEASKKMESQIFAYTISFDAGTAGAACEIIFDDSLIYSSQSITPGNTITVNRRTLRDTVVAEGKRKTIERTIFSQESILHAIFGNDTLTLRPGSNPDINISLHKGKPKATFRSIP